MPANCVVCQLEVKAREHRLICDICKRSTHRCCNDGVNMDISEYRDYRRGDLRVIFYCKECTESAGQEYTGKVSILKPASDDISVDLIFSEPQEEEELVYIQELIPLLTPPRRRIVDYSLSSISAVSIKIICYVPKKDVVHQLLVVKQLTFNPNASPHISLYKGLKAEVVQVITGIKFVRFLTQDMASKKDARHGILLS